ncbi:MAG TPA: MarR family transcriptional regulator [Candidatus Dormibacteraeota bacterium]|jgi:DNA-binding MarR family transcriptional regulator|nr:MarR family transcriptional regulator [Candidatus Dormibacteraeota bacterium]
MAVKVERKPSQALWKLLRDDAFASLRDDFTARVAECTLSLSQGKLIRELAKPQSQRELARRLHYDPSNITALADSLEARGLIERRTDASDRRFRLLALTPEGERLRASLEALLAQPPHFLDRLTIAEQKQLLQLLAKVFAPEPGQPR